MSQIYHGRVIPMERLTWVSGAFAARVLAARLRDEGIDAELRGALDSPYGFTVGDMARVDVFVPHDQAADAQLVMLAIEVDAATELPERGNLAPGPVAVLDRLGRSAGRDDRADLAQLLRVSACPDCGIDIESIAVPDAVNGLRTFPRRYREALEPIPTDRLMERPTPDTWSILEYAVHVREVLDLYAVALPLVLEQSHPVFPDVDPDAAAASRPAAMLDRAVVLDGITHACGELVARANETPNAAWDRPFTIGEHEHPARFLMQKAAHEGAHHLRDIERVRAQVIGASDR